MGCTVVVSGIENTDTPKGLISNERGSSFAINIVVVKNEKHMTEINCYRNLLKVYFVCSILEASSVISLFHTCCTPITNVFPTTILPSLTFFPMITPTRAGYRHFSSKLLRSSIRTPTQQIHLYNVSNFIQNNTMIKFSYKQTDYMTLVTAEEVN